MGYSLSTCTKVKKCESHFCPPPQFLANEYNCFCKPQAMTHLKHLHATVDIML